MTEDACQQPSSSWDRSWKVSLDGIDNAQQHSIFNTQLVCMANNCAKHDLAEEEFLGLCRDVVAKWLASPMAAPATGT